MDLSEYQKETFEGVITVVRIEKLSEWLATKPNPLTKKQMQDWNNLDREHICVLISSGETTISDQFLIPQVQGYTKSNLKKFVDGNGLPADTDEWVNKAVKLRVDKGFLRVAL